MECIRVKGNIKDISNSISFYQNLSTVGMVSIDELRKTYIDMYLNDYKKRYVKKKSKKDKKVSLVEEKKTFSEKAIPVSNEEIFYQNNGVILEDAMIGITDSVVVSKDTDDVEYSSVGVILEDAISYKSDVEIQSEEVRVVEQEPIIIKDEKVEYVSNGVILEDCSQNNLNKVTSEEFFEEDFEEVVNDFDEDISDDVSDSTDDENDFEFLEGVVEIKDVTEKFKEDELSWRKDNKDFEYSDHNGHHERDRYFDERHRRGRPYEQDRYREDSDVKYRSHRHPSEEDDFRRDRHKRDRHSYHSREDDYDSIHQKNKYYDREQSDFRDSPIEENSVVTKPEKTSIEDSKVNSTTEDTTKKEVVSYKNVRDFVKQNPGCTMNEIKEYFSVKEVQKALMGSKIAKKKNKFYII